MLIYLRSMLFSVGYSVLTFIYGSLFVLLFFLPPGVRRRIVVHWTSLVVAWLKVTCGIKHEFHGRENIPDDGGPWVILSKHQSTWETFFLQGVFRPASTILKKELLNIPFFGWGLRGLNPIAIDRSNPRDALRQVKAEGIERLRSGTNLLLFPEGTRIRPGEKGKYARSGAEIACEVGVAVIPVAVNSGHCWPPNTYLKYPGTIHVVVGEPIRTEGRKSREVMDEVQTWIENEMAKMPA